MDKIKYFFGNVVWFNIAYYCYTKPREIIYNIKYYISNRIRFNWLLREWRDYDAKYQIDMFAFGMEQLANAIEKRSPVLLEEKRKQVYGIRKFVYELRRDIDEEAYETVFGKNYNNGVNINDDGTVTFTGDRKAHKEKEKKYAAEIDRLNKERFDELNRLFRGQTKKDIEKKCKEILKTMGENAVLNDEVYRAAYDGSGVDTWWW